VIRYVGGLDGQRHSKEVAHRVTSLTPDNAAGRLIHKSNLMTVTTPSPSDVSVTL